jgi:hypothetical protein
MIAGTDDVLWDVKNADTLFEATATLVIARSAVIEASRGWSLGSIRSCGRATDALTLSSERFRCRIDKGRPRSPGGLELLREFGQADVLSELIRSTGNGATGGQPDIVLTFWDVEQPDRCVTFLADAKRNFSGTGRGYLADSIAKALVYEQAYRVVIGLTEVGRPCVFRPPRVPAVTLFFYQSVPVVAGVETTRTHDDWQDEVCRAIRRQELPLVFALDLRHFGVMAGGGWSGKIVGAWFDRLAKSAIESLGGAGQALEPRNN